MWQRRFGGDKGIIGQSLTINGDPYTVIGVLPASFSLHLEQLTCGVLTSQPKSLTARFMHGTNLIGRLKPGVSAGQAQSELSVIAGRIEREHYDSHAGTGPKVHPVARTSGRSGQTNTAGIARGGWVRPTNSLCNVASLLLTRSLARQKEVRSARRLERAAACDPPTSDGVAFAFAVGVRQFAYWRTGELVGWFAVLPDNNSTPFHF